MHGAGVKLPFLKDQTRLLKINYCHILAPDMKTFAVQGFLVL